MKTRYAAILIALILLVGFVGIGPLLSSAVGGSPGANTSQPGTTSTPPPATTISGGTDASPAPSANETGTASAVTSVATLTVTRSPTRSATPTIYIEQDSGTLPDARTSGTPTPPPTQITTPVTTPVPSPASVTITLRVVDQTFTPSPISVPAGSHVTVIFQNMDAGVPHNMMLFADQELTELLFSGKIIVGRNQVTYTFTAPTKPGEYVLACGVPAPHRTGTLIVE